MSAPRVAIFGAGKVGCAIYGAFAKAKASRVILWTRSEATAKAAQTEGFPAITGPMPRLDSGLILLAVSDDAVAPVAASLVGRIDPKTTMIAHTAGALDLTPLAPLSERGHGVGSFHPMVSVASRKAQFAGHSAAIAYSTKDVDAALAAIALVFGMDAIWPHGDRARYHAACSMVGNFPQALLEASIRLAVECAIDPHEAKDAFGNLMLSAARNAVATGPAKGLTGPARRGDAETLKRHLAAIANSGDVDALYRAATRIAIALAESQGAPNVDEMRLLLD